MINLLEVRELIVKNVLKCIAILCLISILNDKIAASDRGDNPAESEFLAYEKHRFSDLSMSILTESGREVVLEDDFSTLVTLLEHVKETSLKNLRNSTSNYYRKDKSKNFETRNFLAVRALSGNLAIGRVNLILKDGTHIVKNISQNPDGSVRGFLSGTLELLSEPAQSRLPSINKTINNTIMSQADEFYLCESGQVVEGSPKEAFTWFRNLIAQNPEFFRYSFNRIEGANVDVPSNKAIKSAFFHSEQSLFLYITRHMEELLNRPSAAGGPVQTIAREEVQVLVIDIVTERDMCDHCFKTLYLVSKHPLEGMRMIFRVVGTRAHESQFYNSRTALERENDGKHALQNHLTIPNLNFLGSELYVKNN